MRLFLLFFILVLFTGCSKEASESGVKIIKILGENTANIQSLMTLEKEYEKLHPNIDIEFHPNTFEDALLKSTQDFANGSGIYDIVMQYNFSLSSFVRNDYVVSIENYRNNLEKDQLSFEKDLFQPTWINVGHYYRNYKVEEEGVISVGYPFAANSMLLVYNRKMFENKLNKAKYQMEFNEELEVPKTWEQFRHISKFFTNKEEGTFGVCLEGAAGGWLYYEFMNFLQGMGGKVQDTDVSWKVNSDTPTLLNSPEALKALEYFVGLKQYNAGSFSNVEQFREMEIMKEGNTAMSISWDDVISGEVQKNNNFKNNFGVAPIPGNKSAIGGGAFFVNKDSKNVKDAFDFIYYVMQPEVQIKLALQGLSSPLKPVYDDIQVSKLLHSNALKKSLDRGGIIMSAGPDSDIISEVVTFYVQKAWYGEITPSQALLGAQEDIERKRKLIFNEIN